CSVCELRHPRTARSDSASPLVRLFPFVAAMKFLRVISVTVLIALPRSSQGQASGAFVQPCLAAAADASPVYPTSVFPSAVGEIAVAFHLGAGEHHSRMSAKWIAVDVGRAMAPNDVLGTSDVDLPSGATNGTFHYQLEWFPPGRYRVDVSADGQPWMSTELRVVPDERGLTQLSGLMPMTKGLVWTYDFVQEAGDIARSTEPPAGARLDP